MTLVLDRTDYEPGGRATTALNHALHAGQLRSIAATATAPWRCGNSQSAVRRHLHDLLFADLENANVLDPCAKPTRRSSAALAASNRTAGLRVFPSWGGRKRGRRMQRHGAVDCMQLLFKAKLLNMGQCLACHRDPAPHLRAVAQVTSLQWHTDEDRRVLGERLIKEQPIDTRGLTDCGTCHR